MKDAISWLLDLVTNVVFLLAALLAVGGWLLWRGIEERSTTAYAVLGIVLFVTSGVFWVGLVLFVQWIGQRAEAARERREQEKFRDNAAENLRIMQSMATAQQAQAKMLQAHQATLQRALPAPGGEVVNGDFVAFDASLLDDIDADLAR